MHDLVLATKYIYIYICTLTFSKVLVNKKKKPNKNL